MRGRRHLSTSAKLKRGVGAFVGRRYGEWFYPRNIKSSTEETAWRLGKSPSLQVAFCPPSDLVSPHSASAKCSGNGARMVAYKRNAFTTRCLHNRFKSSRNASRCCTRSSSDRAIFSSSIVKFRWAAAYSTQALNSSRPMFPFMTRA